MLKRLISINLLFIKS